MLWVTGRGSAPPKVGMGSLPSPSFPRHLAYLSGWPGSSKSPGDAAPSSAGDASQIQMRTMRRSSRPDLGASAPSDAGHWITHHPARHLPSAPVGGPVLWATGRGSAPPKVGMGSLPSPSFPRHLAYLSGWPGSSKSPGDAAPSSAGDASQIQMRTMRRSSRPDLGASAPSDAGHWITHHPARHLPSAPVGGPVLWVTGRGSAPPEVGMGSLPSPSFPRHLAYLSGWPGSSKSPGDAAPSSAGDASQIQMRTMRRSSRPDLGASAPSDAGHWITHHPARHLPSAPVGGPVLWVTGCLPGRAFLVAPRHWPPILDHQPS